MLLAEDADAFRQRYQGRLAGLSGAELGAAVEAYERLQELAGRIMSYASLVHAGNLADPEIGRFFQTMQERINAISTSLLFFTLELNRLDDADLAAKEADPALAHYRPWLRDIRAFRPHQLSDEIEKLLHEKYVAGRAAWTRLFDETIADLRFPFRGQRTDRGRGARPAVGPRRRGAPRGGLHGRRGAWRRTRGPLR